ncbi:H+transporting two-sector ATPase E subunit [Methanohalobium evestigatum Z-7303]|uniref:A-type ATP synthase subunit E n=2 Tax=root TaxID=1 RepID=D7E6E3_METEZ|nr:V-type ATP synthase subunit E [Methanohalobium evestigatum]ADI73165.1 H+transporting two-sector ATPase E subunit [Methanohalobium evestigatum Z-7303]AGF93262.1 h+transporting two sector ATPase e subunit [uncultured organism]
MGLETVVNDIMDVAHAEAAQKKEEADTEAAQIIEDAKEKAKKIKGDRLAETEAKIERLRRQEISSANLEVKRVKLNARKEILDEVYNKAVDSVSNLSPSKNEELLKSLIDKYEQHGTRVYSNKESEEIVKKLSSLEYAGNIDCIGGIVIENSDGSVRLNYTYDTILKSVYDQSLKQISDILFG